jgi:hypothetical protein
MAAMINAATMKRATTKDERFRILRNHLYGKCNRTAGKGSAETEHPKFKQK